MKTFKNHLSEKAVDGGYPVDTDSFSNDLANPKNIERINSFLGAMGKLEYMVPEHAVNKIKERLGRLAISFGDVDLSEAGGKISLPLTQFGGRTGIDDNAEKIDDDGVSHKVEGGLSIEITHEASGAGTHFVRAKIV
tara:strand:+ start:1330 stop:1740 length:411 start_codon:yes stop_codon:yes gene_type:complete